MPKNYNVIREKWRFHRVSGEGRKVVCKTFILLYFKRTNEEEDKPCLGIAASKKSYKLAVHRNKAKRRVRALVNELTKSYDIELYDFFFIIRRGFVEKNYAEIKAEVSNAFGMLK